jgi:hypothetical protein
MLKIENGVVFIDSSTTLRDVAVYESIVVLVIPKGAQWSKEYANQFLQDHTDGDVRIVKCQVMNQTGYADMEKQKAEAHAGLDKAFKELVDALKDSPQGEASIEDKKPGLFGRIMDKIKGEVK